MQQSDSCLELIFTTVPPRKIGQENFKCVSYHFENFTCTWNPPDYHTKTEYILGSYLYSDGIHPHVSQCPIPYSNTSCGWTTHSDPPYRQFVATHKLILTTSNKWGNTSEIFVVNNNEVIVAPEVEDLHIEEVASKSVLIRWKVPSKLDFGLPSPHISVYPRLVYEIHVIRGTPDKPDMEIASASHSSSLHARSGSVNNGQYFTIRTNETRINVTNLIPYQTYKFKVRCIVEAVLSKKKDHTAFWSKLVQVTTSTRPDGKCNFTPGPFMVKASLMTFSPSSPLRAMSHNTAPFINPCFRPYYWPCCLQTSLSSPYTEHTRQNMQHRIHNTHGTLYITHYTLHNAQDRTPRYTLQWKNYYSVERNKCDSGNLLTQLPVTVVAFFYSSPSPTRDKMKHSSSCHKTNGTTYCVLLFILPALGF